MNNLKNIVNKFSSLTIFKDSITTISFGGDPLNGEIISRTVAKDFVNEKDEIAMYKLKPGMNVTAEEWNQLFASDNFPIEWSDFLGQ